MPTVQFLSWNPAGAVLWNFFATLTKVNSGTVELEMDFTHPKHGGSCGGMLIQWIIHKWECITKDSLLLN